MRGKLIDEDSRVPLPGATVRVMGSEKLGTTTDEEGNFRIENVPVGRISLGISYIGYEDKMIQNILITSGKETVLDVTLTESVIMMDVHHPLEG